MRTMAVGSIHKTVTVGCDADRAFTLFTDRIASWWPVATHSFAGEAVTDVILEGRVGGELYELAPSGRSDWARVLEWEPGRRFLLEWLIGDACGSSVEVTFTPEGGGTRVDLVHSGWTEGASRESYESGWDVVLAPFVERASA